MELADDGIWTERSRVGGGTGGIIGFLVSRPALFLRWFLPCFFDQVGDYNFDPPDVFPLSLNIYEQIIESVEIVNLSKSYCLLGNM